MSIEVVEAVVQYSKARGADYDILIHYARHADAESGICWPSNDTIANESRKHPETVRISKQNLIATGELNLLERGSNRKGVRKTDTLQVTAIFKGSEKLPLKGSEKLPLREARDCAKGSERLSGREARTYPQLSYEQSVNKKEDAARPVAPKKKVTEKNGQHPEFEEFRKYAVEDRKISEQDARDQFDIWQANDWCDGRGVPIRKWKGKLVTFQRIHNLPSDKARLTQPSRPNPVRKSSI